MNAPVELTEIVGVVAIVDREHGHAVVNRREAFDRFAAHALSWAIGRGQLGMSHLDFLKLLQQSIEFLIGDFGARFFVVETAVMLDQLPQFGGAMGCGGHQCLQVWAAMELRIAQAGGVGSCGGAESADDVLLRGERHQSSPMHRATSTAITATS